MLFRSHSVAKCAVDVAHQLVQALVAGRGPLGDVTRQGTDRTQKVEARDPRRVEDVHDYACGDVSKLTNVFSRIGRTDTGTF